MQSFSVVPWVLNLFLLACCNGMKSGVGTKSDSKVRGSEAASWYELSALNRDLRSDWPSLCFETPEAKDLLLCLELPYKVPAAILPQVVLSAVAPDGGTWNMYKTSSHRGSEGPRLLFKQWDSTALWWDNHNGRKASMQINCSSICPFCWVYGFQSRELMSCSGGLASS